MLTEQTIDKLNAMKLHGMADAFNEQLHSSHFAELSPSKNVSDSSSTPSTLLEKIADSPGDCAPPNCVTPPHSKTSTSKHPRRLNRQQIMTLSTCAWLTEQHNLIVSGPTGNRQILHRLRARRTGLSSWFQPPSTSALPDSSTSSLSLASMALIPQSSLGSPSSICSPSTTGSSPRSRTPNDNI